MSPKKSKQENVSGLGLNPFLGSDDFLEKDPKTMSSAELKLYLHIKKLKVRLEFERFQSSVNYTGMLFEALDRLGIRESLLVWVEKQAFGGEATEQKTNSD
ncbi:hypothetical protein LEP1GSC058_1090 [Leptospira fainei serovar Hurstbridge str. BUT 6]|uniref:Uncharacterized protein n=1 Tax=Leptospira fainei serovar Hurstbridge str. BUT 6 TaxID=1193011 RepID=S3UQM9_9LEPT|nr:hypothetical protein [Leptospira fainei]EPG72711.1 hypothetical protein LEP1GSC058_1090 [Leptospira fainei serovar Hurstbridge str. BUT 6]